jgi:hypothetical protein
MIKLIHEYIVLMRYLVKMSGKYPVIEHIRWK